jgi:hypothetical protein
MQRVIDVDVHKETATFTTLAPDGTRPEARAFSATSEGIERFTATPRRGKTQWC